MRSRLFETEDLSENLKQKTIKGGAITMIAQLIKLTTQIVSNVVLARLLTPQDFGLVAMVTVVATFIVMFKDLGLSQATVQSKVITHEQVSSLFWINVIFGFIAMLLTMLLSGYVADFYNQQELKNITLALSFGLFIGGATVQHQALLRRRMMYKQLALTEISSTIFGVGTAIILATLGYGYWSLIALQISQAAMSLILVFFFTRWVPSLYLKISHIKQMLVFGGYMTIYSFVNFFARNLDTILIGWKWGASPVGLYSRAYSLLLLPIGQITAPFSGVAVPTLSRLQDNPVEYSRYYFAMVRVIAFVSMPLIIVMSILSYEIVVFLLGERWSEAAGIFKVLAFAAFWQPIASTVGWVYVSLGRVKRMMYWGFIGTSVMGLFIVLGLDEGAIGVAKYYAISMWILVLPLFHYAFYGTELSLTALLKELILPIMNSILIGACFYLVYNSVTIEFPLYKLIVVSMLGLLLYIPFVFLLSPLKKEYQNMFNVLRSRGR
ncbi:lipopolysaccharide biosynthesis protein [Enterovibrio sp. 27052020O]|uniref:lipopolysaccharide biosynthesis protein n=1 Tax=Enterovibrio sp. 27052020O TaxID=3241166 RepID=UPI00388FB257